MVIKNNMTLEIILINIVKIEMTLIKYNICIKVKILWKISLKYKNTQKIMINFAIMVKVKKNLKKI